jgi:pullulanase/glycogen debranching enzyme
MGQSLKARFNGNSGEVVKYAREFGIFGAMQEYQVKDYVAMLTFLKEQAPDEVFQVTKVNTDVYATPDAFDKLLESMLRKYAQMEKNISDMVAQNAELKKQVDYYRANKWQQTRPLVEGIMQYCEGK